MTEFNPMRTILASALSALFILSACMNPSKYEDISVEDTPVAPDVVVNDPGAPDPGTSDPGPTDPGTPDPGPSDAIVDGLSTDDGDATVDSAEDVGDQASPDVSPTDVPDGTNDSLGDGAGPTTCLCTFSAAITSPTAQIAVYLTGDFLDPPWPGSEDGGIPMEIESPNWVAKVTLIQGQTVEYKYLAKWPDLDEFQWCIYDGTWDCDGNANNQVLVVNCGLGPCDDAQ
jgi:hypothetical protein